MKITANSNVKHNGKWYKDGESLGNVKKEDAERLITLGVAVEAPVESDSKTDGGKSKGKESGSAETQTDDTDPAKNEKNTSSSKKTEDE